MAKLSLGQAAKLAGTSKTTLSRMLARGEISGTQRADSVWEIDASEIARVVDLKKTPGRGRKVEAKAGAWVDPAPDAVDLAVLRVQLEAARERLAEAVEREQRAEERAAEALRREREAADRLTRLIEDQRPRSLWSRLTDR